MPRISSVLPARLTGVLVVLAGTVAGVAGASLAGGALGNDAVGEGSIALEASHLPPLLTLPGEKVSLDYDVFCIPSGSAESSDGESGCQVTGSVFARPGQSGTFSELPLTRGAAADSNQLEVDVPDHIAQSPSGFSYYAVLREEHGDETISVPAGGAFAPHVSLPLAHPTRVDLGRHVFGETRRPDDRLATVAWGVGPAHAGLEPGRLSTPIGASAFDVDRDGSVYLLDEAQHALLVRRKGRSAPARIPVAVTGTLADMTVAHDGTVYVLETAARPGRRPLVRRFDGEGRELEAVETAERTASQIRLGPMGPVVLQQPAQQWMPAVVDGVPADPAAQTRLAHSGRPLPGGGEVVVLRRGNEIRVAVVGPHGARRGWILTSDTDVAEVQLAEPLSGRLVVVLRVYTGNEDEFLVVLLDGRGAIRSFSIDPSDWAESAPLGRFKLVGSSLYRLGSTAAGVFVDRFDLGVE